MGFAVLTIKVISDSPTAKVFTVSIPEADNAGEESLVPFGVYGMCDFVRPPDVFIIRDRTKPTDNPTDTTTISVHHATRNTFRLCKTSARIPGIIERTFQIVMIARTFEEL